VSITTLTTRGFGKRPSRARKAAAHGPVFIAENGMCVFVLLTIEDYRALIGAREGLIDCDEGGQPPDPPG